MALFHPFADNNFRFSTLVAGSPSGIRICGINKIQTRLHDLIQNFERAAFVYRPAENITAENQRWDFDARFSKFTLLHIFAFIRSASSGKSRVLAGILREWG